MKAIVGNSHVRDAVERGRVNFAAIRGRQAGAGVIKQNDQNVRRVRGQMVRRDAPLVRRVLQGGTGDAGRRSGRKRQHFLRTGWRRKNPADCKPTP